MLQLQEGGLFMLQLQGGRGLLPSQNQSSSLKGGRGGGAFFKKESGSFPMEYILFAVAGHH